MNSLRPHLNHSLKVVCLDQDQVEVSITLPTDHYHHFLTILDSLTALVHVVKKEIRVSQFRSGAMAAELEAQAQKAKQQYFNRIVKEFTEYTADGLKRTEAIKKVSAKLRHEEHPWSSPDLVRHSLIEAGHGGRPGRPRSQS